MISIMYLLVLSLICCLGLSGAQILQDGQCDPSIQLATNFDVTQFLNDWYVVRRTANPTYRGDCASLQITQTTNSLNVYNRVVNENFLEEIRGTATIEEGTAKFTFRADSDSLDFWILRTDYQNFAVGYSCENQGPNQRNVYIWQLGRQRFFATDMMEGLMNQTMVTILGITTEELVDVDHSDNACTILSEIPPGQPIVFPGQCNANMAVVQNFDVSRFMGLWHQYSSYYTTNALGTCNRAEYSLSGGIVNVVNSQIVNQNLESITGTARVTSTDNSARLMVTLEVTPGVFVDNPLSILATDYESYAVSYTCTDLPNNQRRVNAWLLSRSRELTPAAEIAINRVIRSEIDLNNRYFIRSDHSNSGCFFFPEPSDNPVIFRGQCDDSIPAMPTFEPARYMGLWHNIESYPSTFQPGTCNNAEYTLTSGIVDVYNTQVINQRLDTINGVATLASTDGSAKLLVSFPIAGTNSNTSTDYWVLGTDYTTYALVYSCTNINNDEKRIASWKLSRTKQLSASARTTIDSIVSTIPVLDQRYYQENDQSVSGCFYYPEPEAGVPVTFPGQCEDNIAVTTSFNLAQFQGTWYEIQAYPKEQQPGQCISHAFNTSGNNGFTLVTTSVNDQFLQVANSNVLLTSTDGSAKMTITIRVNNQDINIPYWILDTDYTNYALAYSCVNINSDFRTVYSWKLSRTNVLSTQSNTAINTVISRVTVLDERYYETIDQSNSACFYLPELTPGEPVILNGQCDQNIQVVQNFNAAAYLGRWRLMESYSSDFQSGTCSDATYTLATDGSVMVYNTQVINQALLTMNGSAVVASNDNTGKLLVTFPDADGPSEYWILDTDYSSYALVYSCRNINAQQRRVWSWKLSRTRELSPIAIENMNRVINTIEVLNNRYYAQISHTDNDCFYYPTASPDRQVIFRGQCDPNINVVTNFNAVNYMSLWHDIQSYPTNFQEGTCNNAFYTLVNGTVDVFNTQVINQRLDTIRGNARLATIDGSAKLIVSFPIAGTNDETETPYWVLATDYTSYALVYSCVNIDEETRQVWSWKLSRSKSLTTAADTAINNVINTIPVLDNRYYNAKDQSREGCFYYPEPQPGEPVVFPGQCDTSIQAILNFNMDAFQGTWYEIEAYPKDQQTGQCINHQYSLTSNNILDLISSNVNSQILGITNSRVTFSSAQDSSGRLTITLTSGGQVITIPFWILSTDYSSYALAYSCVNLNNDFTGVYSWKLSRTKQLTPAANTAINAAIANVVVLDNRYYESIDQSDEACFYLPDAVPNQPVEFPGQCDETIPAMQNFNPSRYTGRWRLIESYPEPSQVGSCNDATYTLNADGTTVDVYNTQVRNQELDTITGRAVLASTDGSAKLLVYFPETTVPAPYWVLDTDYDSYALVYSCRNLDNNRRRVTSWKLSRTSDLTANAVERINQVVDRINVLNSRYYARVDQSDQACFYYPTPGLTTPVIFRGQCDQNIPVVTNFNAEAYTGLWHDISSYPTQFQEGTCNNAFYTLIDGAVDVFNTQVINQTLDTMSGNARLATTDGTAKLIVSFPIAGTNQFTETPYWVLATDYQTYSLVYTCVNINAEQRQVWSWKLSRSKSLTTAADTAINNVINTIPVLDNRYYNAKDQSREGCFYYPEPQPGVPVVFPGQCDTSIQAIPNFNMEAFQGTWYEIEAYPKDQQTGQCINHQYSLSSNNILDLISSNVNSQILGITNSRVTFSSAQDSSGRLTITLTSGGQVITIPFWVINTDYNNYALAYSCVNLNNDFTGVYSWKLSRTKQLTPAANTAINAAIANVVVLDNRYYESIDQSDEACFYLPDAVPNQPVEFPGQCDETIPAMQNFNPSRYTGRWRLIESYPEPSQVGSCNDATYTLNADGTTVDVYNTQVRNQELDTITGRAVLASNDGSAKLLVYFPGTTVPAPYWVLDTDYDSYALVYSCRNLDNNRRRVTSWKLSRSSDLTAYAVERINQVVDRVNVLNSRYYARVDQSDQACFYYPTPGVTTPVIFRGQCDQNIPVVTNFNAAAYLGLWNNVQSYPTQFQEGTCNNALYSLGDGVVDVFNTQVVNETLDTMTGVARFATTSDIGKLIVSFPIAGTNLTTETPYWILATDYQSYSLVYTCVNIDPEYRRVWSWKLSRTKQLTTAAVTAINAVTNTIPVLDDRYYNNDDQSDEGCFYYPEPEPGKPVVFPGQCDQNIQAIPNFNMAAFQGTWYEIAAYPKDQQSGQCINHDYTLDSSNSLNLASSNVINQVFGVTSSRVTFSSAQDTSGRLTITLTSGGSTIQIPFWVLNTDYTDYALAYSCVNVDSSSRAVYSWKLSRTKTLSTAGNTAINNRIDQINVLDNLYYENIDQSDAACFFLPELSPGQPVVFVGQCDQNIPVVQNFRPDAYAGRWRMIDTYTSDFQNAQGSCIDATYTLTPSGTVDVYNTQVINQALDTITGNATLATTDGSAKLLVNFPTTTQASEYWILDTDYTSFALVYSCLNINPQQRRVWSWKLSRTRELTATATERINQVINTIEVLDERYYNRIDHSDNGCFYFPTPDGNPVVFRGQCDESIPVVTNFNAAAYMGTWYDIESYPVRFQDGTCPTATYTLAANGVDVYNTQVVGQELDTIDGFAVLATTDSSAKLTVSFPVAGTDLTTNSPYWVLATDYTNYAFVYSCVNIDDEYRRVGSWKLSRTKSLTAASNTAINNVVNTIPVLRQDYYLTRGHTDENCFYYPDNNGGPVIQDGQCNFNSVNIVTGFSTTAFAGSWYEISRFPSEMQEGECVSNEFTANNQEFRMTKNIVFNEREITFTGPATLAADGRGILSVNLRNDDGDTFETTLYVLDVEYNDFALLYGCRNINDTNKQIYSWKLSRSQSGLSTNAVNRINQVVTITGDLFENYYDETDQTLTGCFHYPIFTEPPTAIELLGPCDQSIRAKANFNAEAYLGKWYEISSYPQIFEEGECARVQYGVGTGGAVNVVNTQVVNRTLDVQTGTAVVASTDGSGLLEVTFVLSNGATAVANYYVLETDYISFALVYSCRNLPTGRRIVTSWILSRETTLPSQAVPVINNAIENTQGLKNEYYLETNQSEEACFYIPDVNKNEAPTFRGQCDDIQGVQNFDVQRYLGWWHEIESYPTDNDKGTCVSSRLSQIGNEYLITDTNVFDVNAQVNTSTVTVSSNGRLRKTYSNGKVVDIWVLATDYETYSLLYSCENVDTQYRRVWSAKHSKARTLSENAQNNMNSVIESIETLEEQFYQPVDQSDSGCFHYPVQNENQIILPGQCDLNIPVLQDFKPAEYSGNWYQIERYPQIYETGTCVGARYTLDEGTGVITVLNWQVIDGVLDTIEGNATISSTDGSAKLTVNLPSRDPNAEEQPLKSMELYVLTTDYISYSLAYSCVNVGPFQRAVGVWKLSRTRTMTADGDAAINAHIATRQELHQPYFERVEQSKDCDEPSSANIFRSSIIIILICSIMKLLL